MMQSVKGCYTGKVTYARRRKTVTPPNNGARALARAARRYSKNILSDFLKAVLPGLAREEFAELSIVDPHLKREFSGDKLEVLDVKVRTKSGESIDIEIQIADVPEMRSRITYYSANMITEQIGSGGYYDDLKRAISIIITDYDFIRETGRYHTVFKMLEETEHFAFNELMEIHVLNMAIIYWCIFQAESSVTGRNGYTRYSLFIN